jgi:hypothetical protein
MNLEKREQKILNALEKTGERYDIPVILTGIDELVYKHDPHSKEESRLNLVIEDYLFEEAESAPLNAHLNIKIHKESTPLINFLKESFGIIGWVAIWEPVTYFLYGWREGGARINYAIRLKNAKVSIE